jgi:hypothetical protein
MYFFKPLSYTYAHQNHEAQQQKEKGYWVQEVLQDTPFLPQDTQIPDSFYNIYIYIYIYIYV